MVSTGVDVLLALLVVLISAGDFREFTIAQLILGDLGLRGHDQLLF